MKFFYIFILLVCIIFLGFSEERITKLRIVRPNGYYPPYEMIIDEDLTGFHIDLIKEVSRKISLNVVFISVPWKRALVMVGNGEADAITFISVTPEREKYVIFNKKNIISNTIDGFFTIKENADKFNYSGDLRSFVGYKIGTLRGYTYGEEFDNADFLTKDDTAGVEKQLIQKTITNRVDISIGNIQRIKFIAYRMGVEDDIICLKPYVSDAPNYLGFAKRPEISQLANDFGIALEQYKKTDQYNLLLDKYHIEGS